MVRWRASNIYKWITYELSNDFFYFYCTVMKLQPVQIEPEFDEKPSVLYVDDEEHNLNAFKATYRRDYAISTAISANEAKKIIEEKESPFEVVISDQRMPEITGVEFLEEIKGTSPKSVRILLTGFADIQAVMDAINKGEVYRYLTKPWDEAYLKRTIDDGVELFRLRERNEFKTNSILKINEQLEFLARQNLIS